MSFKFNPFTGQLDLVGTPTSSFKTMQTPSGTSPVATSPTDILTFTSSNGSVVISGNAGTDTIDLTVSAGGGVITSLNSDSTAAQFLTIGTAGTDFAISNPGGGAHVLNLPAASSVNTGKLSNTDWSLFNSKADPTLFVPYNGATGPVNLNLNDLVTSGNLTSQSIYTNSLYNAGGGAVVVQTDLIFTGGNVYFPNSGYLINDATVPSINPNLRQLVSISGVNNLDWYNDYSLAATASIYPTTTLTYDLGTSGGLSWNNVYAGAMHAGVYTVGTSGALYENVLVVGGAADYPTLPIGGYFGIYVNYIDGRLRTVDGAGVVQTYGGSGIPGGSAYNVQVNDGSNAFTGYSTMSISGSDVFFSGATIRNDASSGNHRAWCLDSSNVSYYPTGTEGQFLTWHSTGITWDTVAPGGGNVVSDGSGQNEHIPRFTGDGYHIRNSPLYFTGNDVVWDTGSYGSLGQSVGNGSCPYNIFVDNQVYAVGLGHFGSLEIYGGSYFSGDVRIVGNFASDQATTGFNTLGTVVGRMPIYDNSNVFIGYMPIYDNIS